MPPLRKAKAKVTKKKDDQLEHDNTPQTPVVKADEQVEEISAEQVEAKVKEVVQQCKTHWNEPVKSFLEIGRLLNEAKKQIPHGAFMKMTAERLPFSHNTANRLMKIARNKVICAHVHKVPLSWGTLHALCFFPEEELERLIRKKIIHSQTERPEVEELIRTYEGPPIDDVDLRNWEYERAQTIRPRKKPKPLSEDEKRVIRIANTLQALVKCMIDSPNTSMLPPKYFTHKHSLTKKRLENLSVWVEGFAEAAPSRAQADSLIEDQKKSRPKRPVTDAQRAALKLGHQATWDKTYPLDPPNVD